MLSICIYVYSCMTDLTDILITIYIRIYIYIYKERERERERERCNVTPCDPP